MEILVMLCVLACVASTATAQPALLVAVPHTGIYKVNVTSGLKSLLQLPDCSIPQGIAYDVTSDRVFWQNYLYATGSPIATSKMDGSSYTTLVNTTDPVYSMQYDPVGRRLYYNQYGNIMTHDTKTSTVSTVRIGTRSNAQITLDIRNRFLYFITPDHEVFQMDLNGTVPRSLYKGSPDVDITGLTINPTGDMLFMCGHGYSDSTFFAYYYTHSLVTGETSQTGTLKDQHCWRLATDGTTLFLNDYYTHEILKVPVKDSPALATVLATELASYDFLYYNHDEERRVPEGWGGRVH